MIRSGREVLDLNGRLGWRPLVLVLQARPMYERMWDPEVRIDGPVATLWAPYDFYILYV